MQSTDSGHRTRSYTNSTRMKLMQQLDRLKCEREYHGELLIPTFGAQLAMRNYVVRRTLGTGSYSKVKSALNLNVEGSTGKVAVKIIDRLKAPKDFQEKFLPRELRIWPAMNHPNILRILDQFDDSRRMYMVLEYMTGGDMLRFIQKGGAVPEPRAHKWFSQITSAVFYMHSNDITHRDLKLENLLIDSYGNVKICDFGFVKAESSTELSRTYCGSKSYASPEILEGRPYDPRKSDVWAIGVILYIMVTGKMPFDETKGSKHILEEQLKLRLYWPKTVSMPCVHLVLSMFVWDFAVRPDIASVSQHNWFRQNQISEGGPSPRLYGTMPHLSPRQQNQQQRRSLSLCDTKTDAV